ARAGPRENRRRLAPTAVSAACQPGERPTRRVDEPRRPGRARTSPPLAADWPVSRRPHRARPQPAGAARRCEATAPSAWHAQLWLGECLARAVLGATEERRQGLSPAAQQPRAFAR